MTLGFSHTLPSTILIDPDVGISSHPVSRLSEWLAAEAFVCHIKFSS